MCQSCQGNNTFSPRRRPAVRLCRFSIATCSTILANLLPCRTAPHPRGIQILRQPVWASVPKRVARNCLTRATSASKPYVVRELALLVVPQDTNDGGRPPRQDSRKR